MQGAPAGPGIGPAPSPRREEFRGEYRQAELEDERDRLAAQRHNEVMGALRHLFRAVSGLDKRLADMERRLASAPAQGPSGAPREAGGINLDAVASDRDLDGNKGDPTIKYDPKKWEGKSYAGYRFSETAPEYLDAMATYLSSCAYMAQKDPDEKKRANAKWKALDASRARGWAERLRAGWGGGPAAPAGGQEQGGQTGSAASAPADEVML